MPPAADLPGHGPDQPRPDTIIPVPEIRDYRQINLRLAQALSSGARHLRLAGVEGQRLLAADLRGLWEAIIEVEGRAGPELAAGLDAPGLTIIGLGPAADGAGRGLHAGRLLILGTAGDALGYTQAGGVILAAGPAGSRVGLDQSGGLLAVAGPVGRLAAERQAGGRLFLLDPDVGPHPGVGHRGGRLLANGLPIPGSVPIEPDDLQALDDALRGLDPWLPDSWPHRIRPVE